MKIKYIVPPLYKDFFPAIIWNSDLQETKATCGQCIQAPHKYESDLKCCTFWPFIPNYIVGQILSSKEEKYKNVQAVIKEHIEKKIFSLPMGLMAPPDFQIKFKKNKAKVFGKVEDFLCPYYSKETNSCGAWLFRGSVCTSFFCESSYKKKGQTFWKNFEDYLSYLEMGLSQEVLVYNDYSPRDVNAQLDYLNVETKLVPELKLTRTLYKKIWKHNFNKEIEFYLKASEFVQVMPKSQKNEVLGETGQIIKNNLQQSLLQLPI